MSKILFCYFFLLPYFGFCQDINNLDKKKGFNKFKLEEPFSKWEKDCNYSGESEGVKTYVYTKGDITTVFDLSIKEIELKFYKLKLYSIKINFSTLTEENENYLLKKLTVLFGEPQKKYAPNEYADFLYAWIGTKVLLSYSKLINTTKTRKFRSIEVVSQDLLSEKENDAF